MIRGLLLDGITIHAAIIFLLFTHGILILILFRILAKVDHGPPHWLTYILSGFLLSLVINIALGFLFSWLDLEFKVLLRLLELMDLLLLVMIYIKRKYCHWKIILPLIKTDYYLIISLMTVFIIMLFNGGNIDSLADSWWHMSLANKIFELGSVFLENDHLSGIPLSEHVSSYPPGWHLNIALLRQFSNVNIPMIWYQLTPWCAILALMGYYYLARNIFKFEFTAYVAMMFFFVLQGGINAYYRNAAWPGNISYIAFYYLLGSSLELLNRFHQNNDENSRLPLLLQLIYFMSFKYRRLLFQVSLGLLLISILHLAELFWFAIVILIYAPFAYVTGKYNNDKELISDGKILILLSFMLLLYLLERSVGHSGGLTYSATAFVVTYLFVLLFYPLSKFIYKKSVLILVFAILVISMLYMLIDFSHFYTLFFPQPIISQHYSYHIPIAFKDPITQDILSLPQWEHQLRAVLMFNGIIALAMIIVMYILRPNRATTLFVSMSTLSVLVLISPYLFTFFAQVIPKVSV